MRSRLAPWCGMALLLTTASCRRGAESGATPANLRPLNVIVVTIDTLRPDHLHCYGYPNVETPVIDGIARRGALFENAVAQTPLTPPSHASIFTGLYPNAHHVRNTGGFTLPSSAVTLATMLQRQGWDTAAFVSSAVLKRASGLNQGFAVYDDQMHRPGNARDFLEDPERSAGETVGRAVKWLAAEPAKPFFLWVHLYDPHQPYEPPEPFATKYRSHPYDGEIAYADQELGRLLDAIDKKSPPDKTLIAVLSDHGESLEEHGEYTHGVFLYDATLRIAFMIAGPGVPAGARVKQQVRTIDFLPTVLELMGGKGAPAVEGASLVPSFSGRETPTAVSYEETLYPKINMGWAELRAIRTNRWKYIRAPRPELYDLSNDAAELHNVIQSNPLEVQKLEAQLKALAAVPGDAEKVETSAVDQRTMEQLKTLGYLQGFSPRSYELTGRGTDPKDRIGVLKLIATAESRELKISEPRRIALLEQALHEDPDNPSLYYQLGGRLEKNNRHAEAIRLYQTALARGIESGRLHSRIADLCVRAGRTDQAIAEYEKAARLNPSDTESQTNLATAYLAKGRLAEAERVFRFVLDQDNTSAAANNGLGLVAIERQDAAAARGYFERAVQLDPDLVEAQLNLGLLYKMAGDRARARACFETFLAKASPAQYGETIPKVRDALASLQ